MSLKIAMLLLTGLFTSNIFGQSVLSDGERISNNNELIAEPLITEQIYRISQSKRIFVITNKSGQLNQGDFISLLTASKLVARALVAKNSNNLAGIKILKIYSLRRWSLIREKMTIQILRGDDTYYLNAESKKEGGDKVKIDDEDDLYNDTKLIEDDVSLDENNKRLLKTDNIISAGVGQIAALDIDGSSQSYFHTLGSWAYQFVDNLWVEGTFGFSMLRNFPADGIDTGLSNITVKAKYTFAAPFYSFVKPYVGYQTIQSDSPEAGEGDITQQQAETELALVDDLKKSSVIFGVTVLKRLVPGWFINVNLGNDIISAGLSLEF
jgi:hypothetical protein